MEFSPALLVRRPDGTWVAIGPELDGIARFISDIAIPNPRDRHGTPRRTPRRRPGGQLRAGSVGSRPPRRDPPPAPRDRGEIRTLVARGIDAGEFHARDPRIAAAALLSLGIDLARWYRDGGRWTPDEIGEEYAEIALRIVAARV